jgi:hypothetical protein
MESVGELELITEILISTIGELWEKYRFLGQKKERESENRYP